MYESRKQRPITRHGFAWRLVNHTALAIGLLAASLGIGIIGYMTLERLALTDAFLNAAMLLGGMGPVDPPKTAGGKLFAGCLCAVCRVGIYRDCGARLHASAASLAAPVSLG